MSYADAWNLPKVQEFFETARATTAQAYVSEWFFLEAKLKEGLSVLDIGCAQGGLASVLSEHLCDFSYTGVDVSDEMIARARQKHPRHTFHHVSEDDFSTLGDATFDLVVVLGILHLHETWRETLKAGWRHTGGCVITDTREYTGPTIEDKSVSWFKMDFGGGDAEHEAMRLPYIVLNSAEALRAVNEICDGAVKTSHYGYLHPVSDSAVSPVKEVMANVWCIER